MTFKTAAAVTTVWAPQPHRAGPGRGTHSGCLRGSSEPASPPIRGAVGAPRCSWTWAQRSTEMDREPGLEPPAPAHEGPRSELPFWGPLGTSRGESPVQGLARLSCLPGPRGCSPASLLPPLDLLRQLRCTLGNGSDFGFDKNKSKLGRPSQTQHSHPHPPKPPTYRKETVSGPIGWRVVVAMVTMQASGSLPGEEAALRGLLGCQALPLHSVTLPSEKWQV